MDDHASCIGDFLMIHPQSHGGFPVRKPQTAMIKARDVPGNGRTRDVAGAVPWASEAVGAAVSPESGGFD